MSKIIMTTAHLKAKSKEARAKLIELFSDITEYSQVNEVDGVIKYITALPVDSLNETSLYMIEQYKDQAAADAHVKSPPVQRLLQAFESDDLLATPPEVFHWNPAFEFWRPAKAPTPENLIALVDFGFHPGKAADVTKSITDLIEVCKPTEPGFYGTAFLADEATNRLRIVDLFESSEYFQEVHGKSEAMKTYQQQAPGFSTGDMNFVQLRIAQGFVGRD